tara:strand:+ start:610 stop:885 length:276 start_codon:yes stop_codon:yes gene_type:complete
MKNTFEIKAYNVDYYLRGKLIGSIITKKPDREIMGYMGRKNTILEKDILLKNKKYKKGITVTTECLPICGKYIGTQEDKISAMLKTRLPYE